MLSIKLDGIEEAQKLYHPKVVRTAAVRAANTAVQRGKAEAARGIYSFWNLKKSDINRAMDAISAKQSSNDVTAVLSVAGRPISLSYLGAKQYAGRRVSTRIRSQQNKRRSSKSGVYVKIHRGGEVTHKPHAFLAAMESGHIGVFERKGRYTKGERQKIVERKLITIASMFDQAKVMQPTIKKIKDTWDSEFTRQIDLLMSKK